MQRTDSETASSKDFTPNGKTTCRPPTVREKWSTVYAILVLFAILMAYKDFPAWIYNYGTTFDILYPSATQVQAVCLPIHIITAATSLFGGLVQVGLGFYGYGRTRWHRFLGYFLLVSMIVSLCSSFGLLAYIVYADRPVEAGSLAAIAIYVFVALLFGIYFVAGKKKNVLRHKECMFRSMFGWYGFVYYRVLINVIVRETRYVRRRRVAIVFSYTLSLTLLFFQLTSSVAALVIGVSLLLIIEVLLWWLRRKPWWNKNLKLDQEDTSEIATDSVTVETGSTESVSACGSSSASAEVEAVEDP